MQIHEQCTCACLHACTENIWYHIVHVHIQHVHVCILSSVHRQPSHPPVTKASPSLNPPSSRPRGNDDSHETHSAPSSPTRDQPPAIVPRNDVHRSNSPNPRPRSVMVNSEITYTEIQFAKVPHPAPHPTPRPRVNTNYTEVIPQGIPTQVEEEEEEGKGGRQPHEDSQENSRQDSGEQFDPFRDGADDSTWSDPCAFYDQAPPARLAPVWERGKEGEEEGKGHLVDKDMGTKVSRNNVHEEKEDGLGDVGGDEDCTGSAYMDTTQFLRTNVGRNSPLEQCFTSDETSCPQHTDEREDTQTTPPGRNVVPGECGQYDFPTALAAYPINSRDGPPTKRDVVDESLDTKPPVVGQCRVYCTCTCLYIAH